MSLEVVDREQLHATNKGYGSMQAALEHIRDLPRLYGQRASQLARHTLAMVARFEQEARHGD